MAFDAKSWFRDWRIHLFTANLFVTGITFDYIRDPPPSPPQAAGRTFIGSNVHGILIASIWCSFVTSFCLMWLLILNGGGWLKGAFMSSVIRFVTYFLILFLLLGASMHLQMVLPEKELDELWPLLNLAIMLGTTAILYAALKDVTQWVKTQWRFFYFCNQRPHESVAIINNPLLQRQWCKMNRRPPV